MTKRTLIPVLASVSMLLAGVSWLAYKNAAIKPRIDVRLPLAGSSTIGIITADTSDTGTMRDVAWNVFQEYLNASKSHNVRKLNNLAYKLSPSCLTTGGSDECNSRMDRVYNNGSIFKKTDFNHIAYDGRQIILSTDWSSEETDIALGETRSVIYFTRDIKGEPKVLFFTQPKEIVYTFKDPEQKREDQIDKLKYRTLDTDGDTLTDESETCTYGGAVEDNCVETDPNTPDSNNDGWWDSTEKFINGN